MPEATTPEWHGDHAFFTDNPEAAKSSAKYTNIESYFKGAHEAMTKVGKPFLLPDDHSKLTDDQKDEIRANVAVMEGVPATPDGYDIKVPEGVQFDEQAIADLKVYGHERKMPKEHLQAALDLQISFQDRQNKAVIKGNEKMSKANFKQYAEDCDGESKAVLKMEQIKNYLQSKCTKDGEPDKEIWEKFLARQFFGDRVTELVLLRALEEPAQKYAEGGGGPATGQAQKTGTGLYQGMKK